MKKLNLKPVHLVLIALGIIIVALVLLIEPLRLCGDVDYGDGPSCSFYARLRVNQQLCPYLGGNWKNVNVGMVTETGCFVLSD